MSGDGKIRPLPIRISSSTRPHRLVDQDAALSRLKPEFESPWGHYKFHHKVVLCFKTGTPRKGMIFELREAPKDHHKVVLCFKTGAPRKGMIFKLRGAPKDHRKVVLCFKTGTPRRG